MLGEVLCLVTLTFTLQGNVQAGYTWDQKSPMDIYVHSEDGYYEYSLVHVVDCDDYELHVLNMTSQKWMDETVTLSPVWWHQLNIAIPKVPRRLDAFHLFINGGNHDHPWPNTCDFDVHVQHLGNFVRSTGAIAADIRQIPFQPVFFADTPGIPRAGDQIIARTWRYYIESIVDNPDVVLLLPMVKAAKRAVDTVIDYAPSVNPAFNLTKVMPAGWSKRGWATWLLGATDPRVFAMVPVVLTLGRWHENLMHHYRSYGGWSFAMTPYYMENITQFIHHPRAFEVFDEIGIDFMAYNPRLTMPKYIIHGSGDEFFLNDDPWYFHTEILTPKYLLICENAGHGLAGHGAKVNRMMINFFEATLDPNYQWPKIAWQRSEGSDSGTIGVLTNPAPLSVTAWWADTTNRTCDRETGVCRRDFRLTTGKPPGDNPVLWQETAVEGSNGNYRVEIPKGPTEVYRAFFLSFTFAGARPGDEFYFTTEVNVIPNVLPYNACTTAEQCYSDLV